MSWLLWIVVAWFVFGMLANVSLVGKKREPITPGAATLTIVITLVLTVLVIVGGGLL